MPIAVRRDPAALLENITRWLGDRLPGADRIDVPPLSAAEGGSSSETLFLNPRITEGGVTREERWVLRVQATGYQVYQDPSVERQYRVMDAVDRAGRAPLPRMLWLETDPTVLGAPFFVMDRVDGNVPHERYHSRGLFAEVGPADREAMWLSGIEAMAAVHATDLDRVAFLARPELGPTGLDQEITAWDNYLRWAKVAEHPVLTRARAWLDDHRPAERPTGLAWGDSRLGNMIFRDNKCVAVLDWETASLGGAETDLGWWLYFDWWVTEGTGVSRLDGIGDGPATVAAWERFAGRPAQAMEWHEMFGTYRFAIISERAIALTAAAGGTMPVGGGDSNPAIVRLRQLLG